MQSSPKTMKGELSPSSPSSSNDNLNKQTVPASGVSQIASQERRTTNYEDSSYSPSSPLTQGCARNTGTKTTLSDGSSINKSPFSPDTSPLKLTGSMLYLNNTSKPSPSSLKTEQLPPSMPLETATQKIASGQPESVNIREDFLYSYLFVPIFWLRFAFGNYKFKYLVII